MRKAIFALGIAVLLVGSLALVPAARAALPAQGAAALDDPNAAVPVVDASQMVMTDHHADGTMRPATERVVITPEDAAHAVPPPRPADDAASAPNVATEPLTQADGPATYTPGYNAGGSGSGDVAGTLGGASTQVPALTYPFPYAQTGFLIPVTSKVTAKLYFHNDIYGCIPSTNYCIASAAVITSGSGGNHDMLLTEGYMLHAGNNSSSGWSYDVAVCPGYAYGSSPLGCWDGQNWYVPNAWYTSANQRFDYGLIDTWDTPSSNACSNGTTGSGIADCFGGLGVSWNQPVFQSYWFMGISAATDSPNLCTSQFAKYYSPSGSGPNDVMIGCGLDYGAAGGPGIISGKIANKGFVNTDFGWRFNSEAWYGPYFNSAFGSIYMTDR